jgi:hypothetical protein
VYSFSVPIAGATISNVGFHDPDTDAGNDWAFTNDGTNLTWATDDFATNPDANALEYQSMFNFRFDASTAPVTAVATGLLFQPGVGTSFEIATETPSSGGAVDVSVIPGPAGELTLSANEPNPFSAGTRLSFSLPTPQAARLSVVDVAGRTVRVVLDRVAPSGVTQVNWDGRDTSGSEVASGVYFFRLDTDTGTRTVKGTLMR